MDSAIKNSENCCFHCNDPLPRDNPQQFAGVIDGSTRYFCCPACIAVADAINGLGLSQYYRQRDSKPQRPASPDNNASSKTENHTAENFCDIDVLVTQAATGKIPFLKKNAEGFYEAQLFIADIHCASCCWLIEHRLQQLDGVVRADTQLNSHKLTLCWQPSCLPLSRIFLALHEIGYRAAPWQPAEQQTQSSAKQKKLLQRLGVAGLLAMQIHMVAMGSYFGAMPNMQHWMNGVALLLSLPIWFYSADPFFISAWRSLKHLGKTLIHKNRSGWREAFVASMDVPVALAIVAAAINSIIAVLQGTDDVYFDSIAMFVFLLLGARFLEARARSRLAVFAQDPVLPQVCTRIRDNRQQRIPTSDLKKLDEVLVKTGIIPVDGIVISGNAAVEQAVITGEFLPVQKQRDDHVIAGTSLVSGELLVQAQSWGAESHIADLHRRMENALSAKQERKSARHDIYDTVAQFFTPAILLIASGSAVFWYFTAPAKALPAFLAVLVASCPCALTLAIPAALTAATLQLRRQGILVTGRHVLQSLPEISHYVFDKTGTLTQGRMHITNTKTFSSLSAQECLDLACALERYSLHPVASAFNRKASASNTDFFSADAIEQVLHCGVEATHQNKRYRIGKRNWVSPGTPDDEQRDIKILLGCDGAALAEFTLGDPLRSDSKSCIEQLNQQSITCSIVSGDHSSAVDSIAAQTGIPSVYKNCSPAQKVEVINSMRKRHGTVVMIGDGVNDGPVLAHADISIALAEASQTAQLAADVILLNNTLQDLLALRSMAIRTNNIARQNLAWALLYNFSILPLAAAGMLSPVSAAIGMALSSLLVTTNALRLFSAGKNNSSGTH
ncbi:MAG TPA: heavy metal translocating P-type ATPase [Pseudomonadales bacterium]|nr:heavy metal translocating P-type ATPase [Pseudomonadales bacterium]